MASNLYIQNTVDGNHHVAKRFVKQGRKALPMELRRPCRAIASVSEEMRGRLDAVVNYGVLSESDIVNHALMMWFEYYAINCTINCSKQ